MTAGFTDLWQGDIELKEGEKLLVSKFNAIVDRDLLWTDNVLYYTINETDYSKDAFKIYYASYQVKRTSYLCQWNNIVFSCASLELTKID